MIATKEDIQKLEAKLDKVLNKLLGFHNDVPEPVMLERLGRSKSWAKIARNGTKDKPPLFKKTEWYYLNGRTPFYKEEGIQRVVKSMKK